MNDIDWVLVIEVGMLLAALVFLSAFVFGAMTQDWRNVEDDE